MVQFPTESRNKWPFVCENSGAELERVKLINYASYQKMAV